MLVLWAQQHKSTWAYLYYEKTQAKNLNRKSKFTYEEFPEIPVTICRKDAN